MSFLQPWMLVAMPLVLLPVIIHWINQRRHQTKPWGAMAFLMQANQLSRGHAKLRRWLILALRMLVVAGMIFAVTRPLSSGFLGWRFGGHTDTTIVILDRSPSMQESGRAGQSKLMKGRDQLAGILGTLGSSHWVLIESGNETPSSFATLEAMMDSPRTQGATSTADIPKMVHAAVDYLKRNQAGDADVWICSDLRAVDWDSQSHHWKVSRETIKQMPHSIRFHLLAYPESDRSNVSIRVADAQRITDADGDAVLVSFHLSRSNAVNLDTVSSNTVSSDTVSSGEMGSPVTVPVQVEIDGVRTQFEVSQVGSQSEVRTQRIPIASQTESGWGRVVIPADANPADNESFFVFAAPPPRRVVLVSDDREATKALEIAASVSPDEESIVDVEVLSPQSLDSIELEGAALLVWCVELPDASTSARIAEYVDKGGQVIFFPPTALLLGGGGAGDREFRGIRWSEWVDHDEKVMVEHWRADQDLLAATRGGAGLPVGQLEIRGRATLTGEVTALASLSGGDPLLGRVATERGGVYFCTASPSGQRSSLADNGVVLYAIVQRAIDQGLRALAATSAQVAGQVDLPIEGWKPLAGNSEVLSTEYSSNAGVYESRAGQGERLIAVNRSPHEDQVDQVDAGQVEALFEGVRFSRIDASVDDSSGIAREIWRLCLFAMIIAMLLEAWLCLPRRSDPIPRRNAADQRALDSWRDRTAMNQNGRNQVKAAAPVDLQKQAHPIEQARPIEQGGPA